MVFLACFILCLFLNWGAAMGDAFFGTWVKKMIFYPCFQVVGKKRDL
jgi:uncharacterized RDD family membrane protein YckC